jgi:hypothetical protein
MEKCPPCKDTHIQKKSHELGWRHVLTRLALCQQQEQESTHVFFFPLLRLCLLVSAQITLVTLSLM